MKKLLPLLLIIASVLITIGCDSTPPEETVLGVKQVPLDTNVPDESELIDMSKEEKELFLGTITNVVKNETEVESIQRDSNYARYVTVENATYQDKDTNGSVTIQSESTEIDDLSSTTMTINGTLSIGEDTYKMNDFKITYDVDYSKEEMPMTNYRFGGSLICNDAKVPLKSLSKDDALISLLSFSDLIEAFEVFTPETTSGTGAVCVIYDSNEAKGMYSSCRKYSMDSNSYDIRLKFDRIKMEDGNHSFSIRILVQNIPGGLDISIDYMKFDDKYYSPSSIEADEEYFPELLLILFLLGIFS